MMVRALVWGEFIHERTNDAVRAVYPDGIHETIRCALREGLPHARVETATFDQPHHGLDSSRLSDTDVLLWWGHLAHDAVDDQIVAAVRQRVLEGMGLIVLHSGHYSKVFKSLMGTGCGLVWREDGRRERLWVCDPSHPIALGIDRYFDLPHEEMYGEPFGIPAPEEQIFISWFEGGEVFRSGCTWRRGRGKIFYFRPGHEMHPTYFDSNVRRVICNAVEWAAQD